MNEEKDTDVKDTGWRDALLSVATLVALAAGCVTGAAIANKIIDRLK